MSKRKTTPASKEKRCSGKTKAGKPCQAFPVKGSDACWSHAPQLARKRARARANGGKATANARGKFPGEVENIDDVLKGINAALASAWLLANTAERGRLLATIYSLSLKVFEIGELESRVEALEQLQRM